MDDKDLRIHAEVLRALASGLTREFHMTGGDIDESQQRSEIATKVRDLLDLPVDIETSQNSLLIRPR